MSTDVFEIEGKEDLASSLERIARTKKLTNVIELVMFLRDNPEIPLPGTFEQTRFTAYTPVGMTKEQYAALCRKHRFEDKDVGWAGFMMVRKVGDIELALAIDREKVCTKVVKGRTWIDERTTPGHFEEETEWVCSPLLSPNGHGEDVVYMDSGEIPL